MPTQSFISIYNASAGSGKTYNLVKEYIKVLIQSDFRNKHRNLLAITFTNKAVTEMKERVLTTLKDFVSYQDRGEKMPVMLADIASETGIVHTRVVSRASKIITAILHNYAAFDIVTIDTLTHRILRTFSKDLGLSGNFEVSLDVKSLLAKAVDRVIDKTGDDEKITAVLVNYALQKADEDKDWNITRDLNTIAALLNQENDAAVMEAMKEKSLREFEELSQKIATHKKTILKKIKDSSQHLLDTFTAQGIEDSHFSRKTFYNHVNKLAQDPLTVTYDSKSKWQNNIEEYSFYNKSTEDSAKNTIDSLKQFLIKFFYETKASYYQLLKLHEFEKKIVPLSTLQLIHKELQALKEEENVLLISDFNTIIFKSLKEQPAAFIYERLGERYTNYFIDEFQDTSVLQWSNLISLVDNALLSESNDTSPNSLIIVGDPKQAIYRWRGGKAEQFISLAQNNLPFPSQASIIQLETNYRSFREVVSFNNAFFKHIARFFDNEIYQNIYIQDNDQGHHKQEDGFVEMDFIEVTTSKEADEIYPEKVLDIINRVSLQGYNKSDICILIRSNKQGAHIAKFLADKNIQVVSSDSLLLKNSATVLFIHDVLLLQQDPENTQTVIRILIFLAHKNDIVDLHNFLDTSLQNDFEGLYTYLERLDIYFSTTVFASLTLYEGVEYIIRCFHLTPLADAYVTGYLDTLFNYTQSKNMGLIGFLDYWQEKKDSLSIDAPLQKDAVQIMTIHKSKGLEFPIVIFPYADADLYSTNNEHQWYDVAQEDYNGFSKLMVGHSSALKNYSAQGDHLYNTRHSEQQFDAINVLYVAFTRAEQRLYVLSRFRESVPPKNYSHLFVNYLKNSGIWEEGQLRYAFGKETTNSNLESDIQEAVAIPFTSSGKEDHNIKIITTHATSIDQNRADAIYRGNLLHEILSQIYTSEDISEVLNRFVLNGGIAASELDSFKATILKITEHPKLQSAFSKDVVIYNEKPIISKDGSLFIPDRVVINTNSETTVMDYKTGVPKIEHSYQLDNYASLLVDMNLKVSKKFLIYINDDIKVLTV